MNFHAKQRLHCKQGNGETCIKNGREQKGQQNALEKNSIEFPKWSDIATLKEGSNRNQQMRSDRQLNEAIDVNLRRVCGEGKGENQQYCQSEYQAHEVLPACYS